MIARRHLRDNWGPEQWAQYIREAQGDAVGAIIETARRVAQAHDTYKRHPERWGGAKFDQWAPKHAGYSASGVSRMETIADVFASFHNVKVLPASWGTLYHLAIAARADRAAFDVALEGGRISPEMTREQAQELADEIRRERERAQSEQANTENQRKGWWSRFDRSKDRRQQSDGGTRGGNGAASDDRREEAEPDTPAKKLRRLGKLLGMLGSNNDNEALTAGRQADELRRAMGVNWSDLLRLPTPRRKARRAGASPRKPH